MFNLLVTAIAAPILFVMGIGVFSTLGFPIIGFIIGVVLVIAFIEHQVRK